MITALVGLWAAVLGIDARADVTVMAVRLGSEIIMRFGATGGVDR
jgi:hypothetical protein